MALQSRGGSRRTKTDVSTALLPPHGRRRGAWLRPLHVLFVRRGAELLLQIVVVLLEQRRIPRPAVDVGRLVLTLVELLLRPLTPTRSPKTTSPGITVVLPIRTGMSTRAHFSHRESEGFRKGAKTRGLTDVSTRRCADTVFGEGDARLGTHSFSPQVFADHSGGGGVNNRKTFRTLRGQRPFTTAIR